MATANTHGMRKSFKLFFIFLFLSSTEAPSSLMPRKQVTIPVNAAFSLNSLWTRKEIVDRFEYTSHIYENACKDLQIKIQLNELIQIDEPKLQEILGYQTKNSLKQVSEILSGFKKKLRPTIIYTRKATDENNTSATEIFAQAYTIGGPRSLAKFRSYAWNGFLFNANEELPFSTGNLDWDRFNQVLPLHGISIIGQYYSIKSKNDFSTESSPKIAVDSHELGHILLNDESHRYSFQNIMSGGSRALFDDDQCELIEAYHQGEALRKESVSKGMKDICNYAYKNNISDLPKFCNANLLKHAE